ncbi:hypothetical protein OC842_005574, partial [Tilletia horrida]
MLEFMTGLVPFSTLDPGARLTLIKEARFSVPPGFDNIATSLRSMMSYSPHCRPAPVDLLRHPRLE